MLQEGVIEKWQLQPGDLIFYEAEYRDVTKAPKRHSIVHVEIYLGPDRPRAMRGGMRGAKKGRRPRKRNRPLSIVGFSKGAFPQFWQCR